MLKRAHKTITRYERRQLYLHDKELNKKIKMLEILFSMQYCTLNRLREDLMRLEGALHSRCVIDIVMQALLRSSVS